MGLPCELQGVYEVGNVSGFIEKPWPPIADDRILDTLPHIFIHSILDFT